jgi:hypothetical protein
MRHLLRVSGLASACRAVSGRVFTFAGISTAIRGSRSLCLSAPAALTLERVYRSRHAALLFADHFSKAGVATLERISIGSDYG